MFYRWFSLLCLTLVLFVIAAPARAQQPAATPPVERRLRLIPAFVIDDRLAALRREASLQAQVLRRLRLARPVYLIESRAARNGEPKFYRVAISRRTRGWLHEAALAVPGRQGEDARLAKRIASFDNDFDKLMLCRLFLDHFAASPLLADVLLQMAQACERAAGELSRNAARRLKNLAGETTPQRDYYLSDTGIDRYTRLQIRFDYAEKTGEYLYDGYAYREILRRFPKSAAAERARRAWEATRQKLEQVKR